MFVSLFLILVLFEMLVFLEIIVSVKSGFVRKNWWIWCLIVWGFRELERFGISVYILMIVGFFNYMSFYDKWFRVFLEVLLEKKRCWWFCCCWMVFLLGYFELLIDGFFVNELRIRLWMFCFSLCVLICMLVMVCFM